MNEASNTNLTAACPDEAIATSSPERCPGWCLGAPGHELDPSSEEWDGGERLHKGPLFGGLLRAWGNSYADGRPMTVTVDAEDGSRDYSTPAELHALVAAAEEAARWLEVQPPAGSSPDRAKAPRLLDAVDLREAEGFLTIDEAAERYGIDRGFLAAEAAAGRVGTVSLRFDDTTEATFLPIADGAVAGWLEAQRLAFTPVEG